MVSQSIPLVCPACNCRLVAPDPMSLLCQDEGRIYPLKHGIWQFLLPERADYYARFLHEYDLVRLAEGRGDINPDYYLQLPFVKPGDRYKADWDLRSRSFRTFVQQVILPRESTFHHIYTPPQRFPMTLKILDLGAGNGWLSNRLAQRGHLLAAVDLRTGKLDGLGAIDYYHQPILAVQAEFDCLPFGNGLFDLVVFNASLHYSEDYSRTFGEALRVLAGNGWLAIVDTPYYLDSASGRRMVHEREQRYMNLYGFPSNAILSENFLTQGMINELAQGLAIQWQFYWPGFGVKWGLRRLKERLRGRREPARFPIILGRRAPVSPG